MPRRRTVVLISAAAVLSLFLIVIGVIAFGVRTNTGRDLVRRYVLSELSTRVRGKVYLGRFRGSIFGDMTIDSIEIRESNDSLFFASGPISFRFRPGDFFDRRIRLSFASATGLHVHVRQDSAGVWNFRKIFPSGPPRAPRATRGFGDYIVLDSLRLRAASFAVTMPWQPDDTLRGVKRDSAITYNLTRKDREMRRVGGGFTRTFRWTNASMEAGYVRIANPDSAGQFFTIHRLDVEERVPPFKFSKIRGTVRLLGDSVFPEIAHFELPGSRGSGRGKVSWGGELPPRYDLRIIGDHVALADINWVYPTLPKTGGGNVRLHITNESDPEVMEYRLTRMDVRSGSSRLRGNMTFAVGGPVLEVTSLDLDADPVDFALLEQLAGEPFPYPWRGTLYGTVKGRGGPLTNFLVDDAQIEFRDANVPGAITRGSARGGLNIYEPGLTVFKGLDVQLAQLDLRTLQFLDPGFPKLNGLVSGKARLDSSWLDVRFSDADLTHRDGDSPPSQVRGNGRVTVGEDFLTYDLALTADSLSFTTLAKSYPSIKLRGQFAGPLRINGTLADLGVSTTLRGAAGTLGVDGTLDGSPPGYAFSGVVDLGAVDLRVLLDTTAVPHTSLSGRLTAEVRGDTTLASLTGRVVLEFERPGHI
ncbi:MAG TPA: hypothetical protein VJ717_00965, partial [Gemmatimonadaceae bacterium]|nr:hypothetical protein [Gemmatimonadaceae bacterium]